jgi:soluble lytic murein transglycosylase-like protein
MYPTEPQTIAGFSTAGGATAAEARVRQLQQLKAVLMQRSQARNLPPTRETFRLLLEEELAKASDKKGIPQKAVLPGYLSPAETLRQMNKAGATQPYPYNLPAPNPTMHSLPNSLQARQQALSGHVAELSQKYGLDPLLVDAVIRQESGYQPKVVSKAGAIGLMQLMPSTAAGLGVKNPYDPLQNMEGGIKYLSQQLKRFDGNVALALAAYNAGPNAVAKYKGVPPYRETQHYVRTILKNYLKNRYQ